MLPVIGDVRPILGSGTHPSQDSTIVLAGCRPHQRNEKKLTISTGEQGWSPTRCSTEGVARASEEISCRGTRNGDRIRATIASLGPNDIEEGQFGSTCQADRGRRHSSFGQRSASQQNPPRLWRPNSRNKIFEQELAQAEKDLIGFRQEAEMQWFSCSDILCLLWRPSSRELSRVRAELVQLKGVGQETDIPFGPSVKRVCRTGERVPILPMPTPVPAELSAWLEERHSELHDALMQGDSTRVLELSTKLSEGAKRMVEMTEGMLSSHVAGSWCEIWSSGRTHWRGFEPRTTFVAEISPGNTRY